MVAHRSDVVLGLPHPSTLDAGAGVERVDDSPTKNVFGVRRRGNEQALGWWMYLGSGGSCLAKHKSKLRTGSAKLRCRSHRQVELQRFRQQEHPVDGRADR